MCLAFLSDLAHVIRDFAEFIKPIAETVFAIVGIYVAIKGLNNWLREHRGKTKYEIASRALCGAYKIRDMLKQTRSALMTSGEYEGRATEPNETPEREGILNSLAAYRGRYNLIAQARNDWYPDIILAESFFGAEARLKIDALLYSCNELRSAIEVWHQMKYQNIRESPHMTQMYNTFVGINPNDNPDFPEGSNIDGGYEERLQKALKNVEEYFSAVIKAG